MNAWLLAVALCVSASAQVVETARVAPPSVPGAAGAAAGVSGAIPTLPPAAVLAPSLGLGATLSAPQARVHFAPPAAAPRAAAAEAAARAPEVPGRASAREDSVPPSVQQAGRAVPNAASFQGQGKVGVIPESFSAQSETGGRFSARTIPADGALQRIPVEGAADVSRRIWDQSAEHSVLEGGTPRTAVPPVAGESVRGPVFTAASEARAARSADFLIRASETETLRDAVASPAAFPAAAFLARPGVLTKPSSPRQAPSGGVGAPSSVKPGIAVPPTSLDRLSLELASGLVVKVRAALGFLPAFATAPAGVPRAASLPGVAPATGAPLTSTEWLERRGLLETISAVESAAGDVSSAPIFVKPGRAVSAAPATFSEPVRSTPSAPAHPDLPSPIFWGLAFLPAAAALLREFL